MKRTKVVVMGEEGLHLRLAAKLVRVAREFRSTIWLKCNGKVVEVQDVLSVLTLCATVGTAIFVEAVGDDEQDAAWAIEQVFASAGNGNIAGGNA